LGNVDSSINNVYSNFYNKTEIQNAYAPINNPTFTGTIKTELNENSRKIVFYDTNIGNEFYGFGLNQYVLRYQATSDGKHVFYCGNDEIMRVANAGINMYKHLNLYNSNFTVSNGSVISTNMSTNNLTINNNLNVGIDSSMTGKLSVGGDVSMNGNLNVVGNIYMNGVKIGTGSSGASFDPNVD
jgi:hypothetical protein